MVGKISFLHQKSWCETAIFGLKKFGIKKIPSFCDRVRFEQQFFQTFVRYFSSKKLDPKIYEK